MSWPYHFVTLNDEQKHQRRIALDTYANIAQSSILTVLLVIQACFLASWLATRWSKQSGADGDSSPRIKQERLGHWNGARGWLATVKKLRWWFGESVEVAGAYLGTRGQVALAAGWLTWLLVLCFPDTVDGNTSPHMFPQYARLTLISTDYLHLTKRFGIVAASQLPLHYLLAFKSPFSPLQLLTGCSHETLNSYHQLLGRIIILLFQLHAVFYLNFFIQSNLLSSKVKELYIICGILGALIFTAIGSTALAPVRKWNYRVFHAVHIILATAWMPVLFWHVTYIHIYIYETIALFTLNFMLRKLHSKTVAGTLKVLSETSLVEIDIPITVESGHLRSFMPGQHAYLSLARHPAWKTTSKSNPFSLSSIPTVDGNLKFYARILNGNTAQLAQWARTIGSKQHFTIEGPYGVRDHSEKLLHFDRALFVAGGVGATFIVPMYRQLLADLSPSRGSYRRQKVSFVWVAKSMDDVQWAFPEEAKEREGFIERLKVYITRASTGGDPSALLRETESEHANTGYAETEVGIELEERQNLLPIDANGSFGAKEGSDVAAYAGRPDLTKLVDQTFSHASSEKVAVFVCGPGGLSRRVREEVGRWVARGRDVWFWDETFAL